MKNLFLTAVLFTCICVFAQQERKMNWQTLNEINKETKLIKPVRYKEFAVFKITDINKFLYQVTISGANVKTETEISNELKLLFRLSDSQQKEFTNNDKASKAVDDTKNGRDMMKKLEESIPTTVPSNEPRTESIKQDLKDVIIQCNRYITELEKVKNELSSLKFRKIYLINLAKKDISFEKMKNEVDPVAKTPNEIYDKMELIYEGVIEYYKKAQNDALSPTMKKTIADALKLIEDAYTEIESEDVMNIYNAVNYLESELKNDANFTVIAPPVQANNDLINFKVSAVPITTNSLAPNSSKTEFNFDIPVKGGLKVDFSVGPTLSFGKGAKDELYYLQESTTLGKSYLRERNNNNAVLPGLAAMMHVYNRGVKEAKLGGLFGVGAGFQSIEDADLSFYFGASLILGKMQKVMLNTGVSFQRVNRLKDNQFEIGKEYTTQDFVIDNVFEKVFKPSFFIGLSYSLAKRVEN